ncbi:DNA-binding protein [Candidatus Wolfebacteria bacterium]|nr:MAG: DNA-binding protein [Candidatus Wolfebacteria bacterium]
MGVIEIESEAFYALVDEIVSRIKQEQGITEDKWILSDEAMKLLGIKSKTTLQKIRDEGKIRFTQPEKKIILYDRESIMQYLDNHTIEPF